MTPSERMIVALSAGGVLLTTLLTLDINWLWTLRGVTCLIALAAFWLRLAIRDESTHLLKVALTTLVISPAVQIEPISIGAAGLGILLFGYHYWSGRTPGWSEQIDRLLWRAHNGDERAYGIYLATARGKSDDDKRADLIAMVQVRVEKHAGGLDIKKYWPLSKAEGLDSALEKISIVEDKLGLPPAKPRSVLAYVNISAPRFVSDLRARIQRRSNEAPAAQ